MAIKKTITKSGEIRWEVVAFTNGRGSKQLRRRFVKKSEAEKFLHSFKSRKADLKKSSFETPDFEETNFKDEAEFWLRLKRDRISPGHLKPALGTFQELMPKYGRLPLSRFTPTLMSQIQSDIAAQGVSATTINRKVEFITTILNFSVRHRRIPYNPSVGFEKMKVVRDELPYWEKEEAQDFLSFAASRYPKGTANRWVYVAYLLAANTGLRAGEIWGLMPEDLLNEQGVILVKRQLERLTNSFRHTKGKENRRVPCNRFLLDELKSLVKNMPLKAKTIFYQQGGKPVCHDNFRDRKWEKDLRLWGGKKIRFHDLRHTAITLMIASGIDLKTVQEIAGHKDIKTTMGYTHLLAERIKYVAQNFSVLPSEPALRPSLRLIKADSKMV